jgi:hypothetical protein
MQFGETLDESIVAKLPGRPLHALCGFGRELSIVVEVLMLVLLHDDERIRM